MGPAVALARLDRKPDPRLAGQWRGPGPGGEDHLIGREFARIRQDRRDAVPLPAEAEGRCAFSQFDPGPQRRLFPGVHQPLGPQVAVGSMPEAPGRPGPQRGLDLRKPRGGHLLGGAPPGRKKAVGFPVGVEALLAFEDEEHPGRRLGGKEFPAGEGLGVEGDRAGEQPGPGAHRGRQPRGAAMAGEADKPGQARGVEARPHDERRAPGEQQPQPVCDRTRVAQGHEIAPVEEAAVAARGPAADGVPFEQRDAAARPLQKDGAGDPDHPAADHEHPLRHHRLLGFPSLRPRRG